MAFSTPSTWVAGTVLTAAQLNTDVRDNIAWMATDSPIARAYNNAAFSHTSTGNALSVTLNSERFDNAALHDTSSNTSRMTIPSGGGGKYLCGGSVEFASNATGHRVLSMYVNATTYAATQTVPAVSGSVVTIAICTVWSFSAADYAEMQAFQNSGGNLNVNATTSYSPEFWIQWLRT